MKAAGGVPAGGLHGPFRLKTCETCQARRRHTPQMPLSTCSLYLLLVYLSTSYLLLRENIQIHPVFQKINLLQGASHQFLLP